jgi:hypothetical protein
VSALAKRILEEARALSPEERRSVALELLEDDDEDGTPEEIEQAWVEEVKRRAEAALRGEGETLDVEEHLAKLRARFG